MNFILIAVLVLGAIALIAALVLFGVSKKFAVEEDPRLGQVGEILPGANCGGCGFAGCSGMAAALVKGADAGSIDGLMCPVGGADVMGKVADLLGMCSYEFMWRWRNRLRVRLSGLWRLRGCLPVWRNLYQS